MIGIAKTLLAETGKIEVTENWLTKDVHVMINGDRKAKAGSRGTEAFCEEFAKNPKFDSRVTRVDTVARGPSLKFVRNALFSVWVAFGTSRPTH